MNSIEELAIESVFRTRLAHQSSGQKYEEMFFPLIKNLRPDWIWWGIASFLALILLASAKAGLKSRAIYAIGISGFTQISFEIIMILLFQIIYGYVYNKIGLIVTFFMGGLGLGSFLMTKAMNRIKYPARALRRLFLSSTSILALTTVLIYLMKDAKSSASYALAELVISAALPFLSGSIGGAIFPLTNRIYLDGLDEPAGRAYSGRMYGIDLLGSSAGACLAGSILIPILGIYQTLAILLILNITAIILLRHHA